MNAPVGPPIWTRLPPSSEIRKPPTIAGTRPAFGSAPEAMAMATLSGSATRATVMPAKASLKNRRQEYSLMVVRSLGFTLDSVGAFLVDQDAERGAVHIVELARLHRPEEGGEAAK